MDLVDSLLGGSKELGKVKDLEDPLKRREADIRNTLGLFLRSPQGKPFLEMLEYTVDSRTYVPGNTDLATTAFCEGYRYLAMQILHIAIDKEM